MFVANDGEFDSNQMSMTLTINATDDGPTNIVPVSGGRGGRVVNEDTDLTIGGISIADPDANIHSVTTTLSADHGTLTLQNVIGGAPRTQFWIPAYAGKQLRSYSASDIKFRPSS